MTPEQVSQQTFASAFRGYSEADVRAFLKRIAEELVTTRDRETELLDAIDALEDQVRSPRPLDESQLLDALGAETTRLLRSAREAADEIRARAGEQAVQAAEAAAAEVEGRKGEADEYFQARTAEAEARAAAIGAEAELNATESRAAVEAHEAEQRARVDRETEELIEAARQQGREMLDEAKATRERVLADLFRRRGLLQAQVDELRGGRDNLLDAYRVVKRSFLEATGALAQVEVRAAERASHATDEASDAATAEIGDGVDVEEIATGEATDATETGGETGGEATAAIADEASSDTSSEAAEPPDAALADVDSLFARIRAGQVEAPPEAPPAPLSPEPPSETVDEMGETVSETSEAPVDAAEESQAEPESEPEPDPAPPSAAQSWRAQRAEVVDPLLVTVAKRAKRTAQDDQNALLDAVRRHKGRPTAAQVLPAEPELLAAWVSVTREAVDEAYRGGRLAAGGEPVAANDELASEVAAVIVLPVRERIASAIDTGEDGDTSGLVERIGARFREWKNQSLENALADALAMAWSRGVYDASPDGAVLQWIPLVEGRCADCDDNGLEPTVKGSTFPTGQVHPPAHPGCRCLLAPVDVLSGLTAGA